MPYAMCIPVQCLFKQCQISKCKCGKVLKQRGPAESGSSSRRLLPASALLLRLLGESGHMKKSPSGISQRVTPQPTELNPLQPVAMIGPSSY